MMTPDLFSSFDESCVLPLSLGDGTICLQGFLLPNDTDVVDAVRPVIRQSPLRHLVTPGGKKMSVSMTNCGQSGWVSDHLGYRYQSIDPLTQQPWPAMPGLLLTLAQQAASAAGYPNFRPDVCLINRYIAGARMGLHQDRDEGNLTAPVVSFSLGLPATFIWGGLERSSKTRRFTLHHGDALVWGGVDRLRFHGVSPLKPGQHDLLGDCRINMTFRQTGL